MKKIKIVFFVLVLCLSLFSFEFIRDFEFESEGNQPGLAGGSSPELHLFNQDSEKEEPEKVKEIIGGENAELENLIGLMEIPDSELTAFLQRNPHIKESYYQRVDWLEDINNLGLGKLNKEAEELSPRAILLLVDYYLFIDSPYLAREHAVQLYAMLGFNGKKEFSSYMAWSMAQLSEWEESLAWQYVFMKHQRSEYGNDSSTEYLLEDVANSISDMSEDAVYEELVTLPTKDNAEMIEVEALSLRANLPEEVRGVSLEQVSYTKEIVNLTDNHEWWKKGSED